MKRKNSVMEGKVEKRLQVMVTPELYELLEKEAQKLSKELGITVDVSKLVRRLLVTHPDLKKF